MNVLPSAQSQFLSLLPQALIPRDHLAAQIPSHTTFQKTQPVPVGKDCEPEAKREGKKALQTTGAHHLEAGLSSLQAPPAGEQAEFWRVMKTGNV